MYKLIKIELINYILSLKDINYKIQIVCGEDRQQIIKELEQLGWELSLIHELTFYFCKVKTVNNEYNIFKEIEQEFESLIQNTKFPDYILQQYLNKNKIIVLKDLEYSQMIKYIYFREGLFCFKTENNILKFRNMLDDEKLSIDIVNNYYTTLLDKEEYVFVD